MGESNEDKQIIEFTQRIKNISQALERLSKLYPHSPITVSPYSTLISELDDFITGKKGKNEFQALKKVISKEIEGSSGALIYKRNAAAMKIGLGIQESIVAVFRGLFNCLDKIQSILSGEMIDQLERTRFLDTDYSKNIRLYDRIDIECKNIEEELKKLEVDRTPRCE